MVWVVNDVGRSAVLVDKENDPQENDPEVNVLTSNDEAKRDDFSNILLKKMGKNVVGLYEVKVAQVVDADNVVLSKRYKEILISNLK